MIYSRKVRVFIDGRRKALALEVALKPVTSLSPRLSYGARKGN